MLQVRTRNALHRALLRAVGPEQACRVADDAQANFTGKPEARLEVEIVYRVKLVDGNGAAVRVADYDDAEEASDVARGANAALGV